MSDWYYWQPAYSAPHAVAGWAPWLRIAAIAADLAIQFSPITATWPVTALWGVLTITLGAGESEY